MLTIGGLLSNEDMFELADKLKALREKKAELAEETKENNAEIEKTEFELSSAMANTETQSFQRAGTLFYLTTKTYASADKEHKDELFEALRARRIRFSYHRNRQC